MKANFKLLVPALLALAMPCFVQGQNWLTAGNASIGTGFLGTTDNNPLRIRTNNTERMILTSTGILGIGIASPATNNRFQVANSTLARTAFFNNTFSSANSTFGIVSTTNNPGAGLEAAGSFTANGGGAGFNIGVDAAASASTGSNYGFRSIVNGSSSNASMNYGISVSLTPNTGANNFGVYSTIVGTTANPSTNHYSGYFNNGRVYVGYRLGVGVTNPLAAAHFTGADNDGTASAVRITSGTQNMLLDGNEIDALTSGLYLNHNTNQNVFLATGGGRIGIGTDNLADNARLHVLGNIRLDGFLQLQAPNNNTFVVQVLNDGDVHFLGNGANRMTIRDDNGYVGFGTATPTARLHLQSGELRIDNANGQSFDLNVDANGDFHIQRNETQTALFIGDQTGRVGIGTTDLPSGYMLSVNGRIISEEVRVQNFNDWPDYVFEQGYSLMPLAELEKNIAQNKRLPGIPSAAEVKAEGADLGEMQRLLLEKVEELTLYIIDLEKKLKQLEQQSAQQK